MYNKLFTKILDSSIWLESTPTRLLWLVFLAAMDEDGYCPFASIPNLAHRARLSLEETKEGVSTLESPDPDSSDPDYDGRRIERVQGGWVVLNAQKYRDMVTRQVAREQTRIRVQKFRAKQGVKRTCNGDVTQSDTYTEAEAHSKSEAEAHSKSEAEAHSKAHTPPASEGFERFWSAYPRKTGKASAKKAWIEKNCESISDLIFPKLEELKQSHNWTKEEGRFVPHPEKWLRSEGWFDEIHQDNSGVYQNRGEYEETTPIPILKV